MKLFSKKRGSVPQHRHSVAIESTSAYQGWIEEFVTDLVRFGSDIREIAYFSAFRQHHYHHIASALYEEAKETAGRVIIPLLPHQFHKHYLLSIVKLPMQLFDDPRTIVVYDLAGLPTHCQTEEHPVTTMSVDMVIRFVRDRFGEARIGDRTWGLNMALDELRAAA